MRLDTLTRDISPPPTRRKIPEDGGNEPTAAAIEAGKVRIHDHLSYFIARLSALSRPTVGLPRIALKGFEALYKRHQKQQHGNHFTVHQHDHPIAGVHYDLRIQFSGTSTLSFAIPYGLPGNPNSSRPNRMGIETRVHNLWNNLIESASHATGSLLIWDTGEYEVLPRPKKRQQMTDDELSGEEDHHMPAARSQSEKLFKAFQSRHIRLRLHGTRLPPNYTISLRLPSHNDVAAGPRNPKRKRRRMMKPPKPKEALTSDNDSEPSAVVGTLSIDAEKENVDAAMASEDDVGEVMRINNAYPGSFNTIGSIHQRHWFITLDRTLSGFHKEYGASRWIGGWEPFIVLGREHERSVVTGRLADEVMADDGVERFVGRKRWRPILE